MIPLTLSEVAEAVGGVVHDAPADRDVVVSAPAFVDSRLVEAGGLFVAVPGEHVDGHAFAERAVAAGAAAVLATRPTGVPTIVVDDAVAGLGRLARHVRDRLGATVLALTGSQGKTGTKDHLAQVLASAGPTVATAGNFNNEIGVPLTILRATAETSYLVLEMGARGIGHIAYLCDIARPSIAAVLNVGSAHLGEFGSREAIAQAKGEIVEALPTEGVAVLNADDAFTAAMAPRTQARVLRFGRADDADVTWYDEELDDLDRPSADLALRTGAGTDRDEQRIHQRLQQSGAFQLHNAAAAAAMAVAAGMDFADVVAALGDVVAASRWRMELHELPDTTIVLNDAYNANPAAMSAALTSLASIGRRRSRRTVAVLGEMRELGPGSGEAHREVGAHAADEGVDVLVAVGEEARALADGARERPGWRGVALVTASRDDAVRWVGENVSPGDVVLVKASRGVGLEHVADALVEQGSNPR